MSIAKYVIGVLDKLLGGFYPYDRFAHNLYNKVSNDFEEQVEIIMAQLCMHHAHLGPTPRVTNTWSEVGGAHYNYAFNVINIGFSIRKDTEELRTLKKTYKKYLPIQEISAALPFILAHEFQHFRQAQVLGYVKTDTYFQYFKWKNGLPISFWQINNLLPFEDYVNLPWEKDANKEAIKFCKRYGYITTKEGTKL